MIPWASLHSIYTLEKLLHGLTGLTISTWKVVGNTWASGMAFHILPRTFKCKQPEFVPFLSFWTPFWQLQLHHVKTTVPVMKWEERALNYTPKIGIESQNSTPSPETRLKSMTGSSSRARTINPFLLSMILFDYFPLSHVVPLIFFLSL